MGGGASAVQQPGFTPRPPPHQAATPQTSSCQPRMPRAASHFTSSPWPGADWLVSQLLRLMRESPRYPQPCPCHLLPAWTPCLQLWGEGREDHREGEDGVEGSVPTEVVRGAPSWLEEPAGRRLAPGANAAPSHGRLSTQAPAPALGSPALGALRRDGDAHVQSLGFPRNAQNQRLLHAGHSTREGQVGQLVL